MDLWGGLDDDILPGLESQRLLRCFRCPVHIFCAGGVWPNSFWGCKRCKTILDTSDIMHAKRLVQCGQSSFKDWQVTRAECNCGRSTYHVDRGYRGCDRLEVTEC